MEEEKRTIGSKLKSFGKECIRVIRVTKKPTMKEYKVIVIISGLGILVIGFIGFLITILKQMFFS